MPAHTSRRLALGLLCAATAALPAALALAQGGKPAPAAPAKPAPVPTEPGSTTASFGDWVLRCQRGGGDRPVRICEAAQTMQVQGQAQPIAQIAIGRVSAGEPLQVTAILPPNVALPSSVRVLTDEKDTTGFELAWRRCLPGGCVAEASVREDALRRWRGSAELGRIAFKNAAGQDVAIPLSFHGLAQALDALAKEPA
ncbi:invasion associated locus B family protein [Methylobacterium sp. E-041]|uniref:invasion associated locus B family protein n=1 Tax=Methylobacterium sp. E-041 TaxID=2836573 RepID=UPI001FBA64B8|nr:invasion associated locus B family protein [Methylobacterium sp. E-041]MCJ2107327.1 invasion associated locus B family protein [Methylobacterium sp. E-041]